jgi:transposase
MTKAEERELRRKQVVEAVVIRGEYIDTVSRVFNVPVRTVFDWLARYRSGGWQALREGKRAGRPRKINGCAVNQMYVK